MASTYDAHLVYGNDGDDVITINRGQDAEVYGGNGNDTITANFFFDGLISGGAGDDVIAAGRRTTTAYGDDGNDTLSANLNRGSDTTLFGGDGADTFEFFGADATKTSAAVIGDFEVGIDSLILMDEDLSNIEVGALPSAFTTSTAADGSLVFHFEVGNSLTLQGVTEGEFFLL